MHSAARGNETAWQEQIRRDGYAVVPPILSAADCDALIAAVACDNLGAKQERRGSVYAVRNLLDIPAVRELAQSDTLRQWIVPILGAKAMAVRGILFDKTPQANWNVVWHQDKTIAVRQRVEAEGFGAWTEKAGVTHVQPPAAIMEQMLSLRLHLDFCPVENGALRVLPGTHTRGILSADAIAALREHVKEVSLPVERGGVLLMRPLLLHSSSPSCLPQHRRVIHLDYACADLPAGLEWHTAVK